MRSPAPRARPSSRLRVVGAACGGSQSEATSPVPSSSTESATSTARRPAAGRHLGHQLAASRDDLGEVELDAARRPGTEMPSSSGTSSGPACDQSTTSPTARPALGLTSSMTELCVGAGAEAGEPLLGGRRPAVRRGERRGARPTGDQRRAPGRRRRRPRPARRSAARRETWAGATGTGRHVVAEPRQDLTARLGERRDTRGPRPAAERRRAHHRRGGQRAAARAAAAYVVAAVARVGPRPPAARRRRPPAAAAASDEVGAEPAHRRLLAGPARRGRAQHQHHDDGDGLEDEQRDPQPRARPVELVRRTAAGRPARPGCRGPRRSPRPARRWRPARRRRRGRRAPAARRTRSRASPAPSTTVGVGRETSARTRAVEVGGPPRSAPRSRPRRAGCRPRGARCSAGRSRRCRGRTRMPCSGPSSELWTM